MLRVIKQTYCLASAAITPFWLEKVRINLMFAPIIARGMLMNKRVNMVLYMYMPIISYCFAQYACPDNL